MTIKKNMRKPDIKTILPALLWAAFLALHCDNGNGPTPNPPKPLELLQPKGGESYAVNQTVEVKWRINDSTKIASVGVKIFLDTGYTMLADHGIPTDTTWYLWTVDSSQVSDSCFITVYEYYDRSIFDKSAIFTIHN